MKLAVPDGLTLLPFQEEAVQKMISFLYHGKGVYNACEMGLGKSIQTITVCNSLQFKEVLIICPAIMELVWEKEAAKWGTGCTSYTILSYNKAMQLKNLENIKKVNWDCLVLDESHYVKNTRAKRTKTTLKEIWPKAKYHIALSGTPFTSSIVDGFTLFNKFNPTAFPDYMEFAYRYAYVKRTPWGDKFFGVKHAEELQNIIRNSFYVRYRKDEVLTELPDKRFIRMTLPESYAVKPAPTEKQSLAEAIAAIKARVERGEPIPIAPTHIAAIKRLQGEKKTGPIIEFVQELLDQEIPVVLFAYHKNVIKIYEEAFKKEKPSVITGETSAKERQERVESFQNGETNLFLGQLIAAGVGITLTASSTVVLAEEDWSPASIAQACDRCHRIGAKGAVSIYYFVVEKSIDEQLIEVVMEKARTFAKVLENTNPYDNRKHG